MTDRQPRRTKTDDDRQHQAAVSMMLLCKRVYEGAITPDELYEQVTHVAPTVVYLVNIGHIRTPAGWHEIKPKSVAEDKPTQKGKGKKATAQTKRGKRKA